MPPVNVAGRRWVFPAEVLAQDLVSEAVLALLEDRDVSEAVRRYRAVETAWLGATVELVGRSL